MEKIKVYVGIDVSKDWLDFACYRPGEGIGYRCRCENTPSGVTKALNEVRKYYKVAVNDLLFCLEHTGVYCAPFLGRASKLNLLVWLESAWKIRRTQQPRGKTDKMDAARIAEYAFRYKDRVRLWVPEPVAMTRLRDLLALRERLIRAANALKVPKSEAKSSGKELAAADMARFSDPAVKSLEKQLKQVETQIDELMAQDSACKKNLDLLCSIPGIGRMTALSLILFTRNFTLFNDARKLACYCGVAPFEYSSGSSIKGRTRVSHYANKSLKTLLHLAAVSAGTHNPDMNAYKKRKLEQGKHKMSVINAIRNKLLHCVMAIITRQTPWVAKFSKAEENLATVD